MLVKKIPTANSQFQKDILGIKLFPNPAANFLSMTSEINKPIQYTLSSNQGQLIQQGEFSGKGQLNLESIELYGIFYLLS